MQDGDPFNEGHEWDEYDDEEAAEDHGQVCAHTRLQRTPTRTAHEDTSLSLCVCVCVGRRGGPDGRWRTPRSSTRGGSQRHPLTHIYAYLAVCLSVCLYQGWDDGYVEGDWHDQDDPFGDAADDGSWQDRGPQAEAHWGEGVGEGEDDWPDDPPPADEPDDYPDQQEDDEGGQWGEDNYDDPREEDHEAYQATGRNDMDDYIEQQQAQYEQERQEEYEQERQEENQRLWDEEDYIEAHGDEYPGDAFGEDWDGVDD